MPLKAAHVLALTALTLLVSCRLGTHPIQTDTPAASLTPRGATIPHTLPPPPTASPTLPATPTSLPPQVPTPIPGWVTDTNEYLGYRLSHPDGAVITEHGPAGMDTNETIPPGFTYGEYCEYVMDILPGNLCTSFSIPGALITSVPPYDPLGSFFGPCPGMGIGTGYIFKHADETLTIAGREYTSSQGTTLNLEGSGVFYGEFYIFELVNGFRVVLNGRPTEGMSSERYLVQWGLAMDSLASLHWFRTPDLTKPGTTCAGAFTRLVPGVPARVVGNPDDLPNRVRSGPSLKDAVVDQIYPGSVVSILEGPLCRERLVFWKIDSPQIPGRIGWSAEGDLSEYWLEQNQS